MSLFYFWVACPLTMMFGRTYRVWTVKGYFCSHSLSLFCYSSLNPRHHHFITFKHWHIRLFEPLREKYLRLVFNTEGSHWSLTIIDLGKLAFYHMNSLALMNAVPSSDFSQKVNRILKLNPFNFSGIKGQCQSYGVSCDRYIVKNEHVAKEAYLNFLSDVKNCIKSWLNTCLAQGPTNIVRKPKQGVGDWMDSCWQQTWST